MICHIYPIISNEIPTPFKSHYHTTKFYYHYINQKPTTCMPTGFILAISWFVCELLWQLLLCVVTNVKVYKLNLSRHFQDTFSQQKYRLGKSFQNGRTYAIDPTWFMLNSDWVTYYYICINKFIIITPNKNHEADWIVEHINF